MKFLACFSYVTILLCCYWFGDTGRFWGGLFILNMYLFVAFMSWIVEGYLNEKDKLFFTYIKFISLAQAIYVITCYFMGRTWSLFHKDITATIIGIGFATFLLHTAFKHNK